MRASFGIGLTTMLCFAAGSPVVGRENHDAHRREVAHKVIGPHKEIGKASIYSSRFQGRHMSDGQRFNVHSSDAASKVLPLGTEARVTDLKTRKSADVIIKDRGPVPRGRVIDLTPRTAGEIGLTRKQGIAPVAVVPISVPASGKAAVR